MSGSKLVFTIFLIIILSLGGLLGFYFYLNRSNHLNQTPVAVNKPTFSGFDQVILDNPNVGQKTNLGSYTEATSTASSSIEATTTPSNMPHEERLRLISAQPIAGYDFITRDVDISTSSTPIGTSTSAIKLAKKNQRIIPIEFIRYILRANGNIFETGTSSTSTTNRLTNKTIPKLQEAFFNSSGDGVVVRNIIGDDAIQTRYLSLKNNPSQGTSTIQDVVTTDLPLNITQISTSPDKSKVFYTKNTGTRGVISTIDGAVKTNLFESVFKEWLPQWVTSGTIFLNTKPSGLADGYLYSLDSKTGNIKKVLGGLAGLTTLGSNDGLRVLYTVTKDNYLQMSLYDSKDNSNWVLPAQTLPEKCVWGNKYTKIIYCAIPKNVPSDYTYPDDWYLGLMHFNDVIWRMNLATGENKLIVDPERQTTIPLDVINMKLSKNDDYLTFEDKRTLSLWGIKLETPVVATSTRAVKTSIKK